MTCNEPTTTTGGTFDCAGGTSNFGETCALQCQLDNGYTGDITITCNYDSDSQTVKWSTTPTPTCTCKSMFSVHISNFMFFFNIVLMIFVQKCAQWQTLIRL